MNKEEIYEFIKNKNIWYEITKHKAVFNMEELKDVVLPYPESDAKNLFVRDDKKKAPKITASDVGIALSIFLLLFQIFCHVILPRLT